MTERAALRGRLKSLGIYLLLIVMTMAAVLAARSAKSSDRSAKAAESAAKGVKTLLQDRITETDKRRQADLAAAKAKEMQDARDASVLAELKRLADASLGNQAQITAVLEAVKSCTTPAGECSRITAQRTAAAITALQKQHDDQLAVIKELRFQVQGTVAEGQFEGTARTTGESSSAPPACIGVGNVDVVPGVLGCRPNR